MKDKIFLNKTLFWDVEYKNLDKEKNISFIIERVLNYGDEKDYRELKRMYNISKIKRAAKEINYINKKNINFWSIIFDIPLSFFKNKNRFVDFLPKEQAKRLSSSSPWSLRNKHRKK